MIIDGTNKILGRVATHAAKQALLGEEIHIINCGDLVVTGKKRENLEKFKQRRGRGAALKGPYYPRGSEQIVRRSIRGMLPYKKPRGRKAYQRIKCYTGVPKALEGKDVTQLQDASADKTFANLTTIHTIAKELGGKQ